jgi:BolA family transcriptional regulator, general stress-responsive regulator
MDILANIRHKLENHFTPSELKVADDSVQHYGHDGAMPGHVSHVAMLVVSERFAGKSRVERTRMVYELLSEEIAAIHAVTALKTLTPEEFAKRLAV